jgi:carbon monoxide dehydrogenase subunit G
MKGTIEVDLGSPPAEVHRRLLDPGELLAGVTGVAKVRRVSGEGGVGTRYEAVVNARGAREPVTAEVVDVEEPRRVSYAVEGGPARARVDLQLEPRGRGSRLSCAYEVEFRGLARLVGAPLVRGWLRRHEGELVQRIASALETSRRAKRRPPR